jgi:hypothetical protein
MVVSATKNNGGLRRFEMCRIIAMIFEQTAAQESVLILSDRRVSLAHFEKTA